MRLTRLILFVALVVATGACQQKAIDEEVEPGSTNSDWTEETHSNTVDPNYAVVFPQEQVNTLEITLTAADWSAIRSDMQEKFGSDFGGSGSSRPGAGNQPGEFGTGDPDYVAVPVKFNGKVWEKVGFRLKGNSSLSSAWRSGIYKLPFRLHFDRFEDDYPEIKNQRFYGFKELSMSPGYSDNSLIREKVVADIFRSAGVPAARTAFYKVYIDFGEGQKYCGVYTMVEVIDDTMVENQFGEDQGNIYKPESSFRQFTQSEFEKKNNETEADYSDVQAFITALNASNRTSDPAQWRTNLENTFNVDHYLKFLAVNNTIVNWDTYGAIAHNYYLYNSPTGKLTWIPWDHNMSMTSSSTGGMAGMRAVSLSMSEVTQSWPLLRYVADDPVYYARYKEYVRAFGQSVFTSANMDALFTKYHTLISPYVIGPEATESGKYTHLSSSASFTSALSSLKSHVSTRVQAVNDFVN
ncbi:CotH kinase family protein [Larkinella sp. VNQ87]|uniref:CotH kinase family protein n=1 Tax=Larkinella sp. VNQ87 TaxID=3400921 RepID=UPI003C11E39A